jgi:penicillin amidase
MAGPFTHDIDHALRIIDYGKASKATVERMPPETRALMEAFVAGLNHYQATAEDLPPEFALLGFEREPFTVEDLLTIGRLAGTDVNWLSFMSMLPQRAKPDWPLIWQRALEAGQGPTVSFSSRNQQAMNDLLWGISRSGSNSVVVSAAKSATGNALIASDPHLGISIPNLWLMAGIRSPSFKGVGLMIPGLPFLALGRTENLTWGGTNMRAANSDLYDIAKIKDADITTREVEIETRLWFNTKRQVRSSRYGQIVSDAPLIEKGDGEVLALRWVGHLPTDEVTSLFNIMRAKDADGFRGSLGNFAVSAQNFMCADAKGDICHVLATLLPKRQKKTPDALVLDASDPSNDWIGIADATELPYALNPPEGFLASANNRPTEAQWPIGYFFNSDERIRRLKQILSTREKVSMDDLKALQLDTVSLNARELFAKLMPIIDADPAVLAAEPQFIQRLRSFDGDYRVDASAPVAFETLLYHLVPATYGFETEAEVPNYRKQFAHLTHYLARDIEALPAEKQKQVLLASVQKAAADAAKFPTWGDMHRLQIQHWFAAMPVIGGFFQYADYPTSGSRETAMKTAHGLINGRSNTQYGSQSRHISDMSDPDANYFVLLGGNDGWLGSSNALDQVPLWLSGEYIRMPLTPSVVTKEFATVMTLEPQPR